MALERSKIIKIDEDELLEDIQAPQAGRDQASLPTISSQPPLRSFLSNLPKAETTPPIVSEEPPLQDAETSLRAVRVAIKILDQSRHVLTDAEASLIESHKAVDRAKTEVDLNTRRLADGLVEHHSSQRTEDLNALFGASAQSIQDLDAALIDLKFAHSWCHSAYQAHLEKLASEQQARAELKQTGQSA